MLKKNSTDCCKNIRKKILFSIYYARSGHVGPSLSCVELIFSILKFGINYKKKDRNKFISLEPSKLSLDIDFEIKYNNSLIGKQRNFVKVYEDDLSSIFNSRTFCLYEDIDKLKKMNLAKGGSLENAIVVQLH